jgi:hypothetical protein
MADEQICTMCEEAPATTSWGFPVCQPCADWLTFLDAELRKDGFA